MDMYTYTRIQHNAKCKCFMVSYIWNPIVKSRMVVARVRRGGARCGHMTWDFSFMGGVGSEQLSHNMETTDDCVLETSTKYAFIKALAFIQ